MGWAPVWRGGVGGKQWAGEDEGEGEGGGDGELFFDASEWPG